MSDAERYVAPTIRSILTDRAHLAAERDAYAKQVRDLTDQLVRQNAAIEQVRAVVAEYCDGDHAEEDCCAGDVMHGLYRAMESAGGAS